MELEITPEPTESERAAIRAALARDDVPPKPPGPWLEPLGDDQEP